MLTRNQLPVAVPISSRPRGFLAGVRAMQRNALALLPKIAFTQPIVSGHVVRRFHMVMDPPSLRRILKDAAEDYPKSEEAQAMLRPALGNGIFLAEGAHWRWQRRAAMPVFAPRNLTALTPVMTQAAEEACVRVAKANGPLDMHAEMLQTAFEVIAAVSMSEDTAIPREVAHRAIDRYLETAGRASFLDILQVPAVVPRPGRTVARFLIAELRNAADAAVRARMGREAADPPPLLDLLIGASDPETGRTMSAEELRDNLLTFLVAGHETTALALSWSLYLVGFDQEVQKKASAEARKVLNGRAATAEDVPHLGYIRQIVQEAMRLYPPVAMLSRTATAHDKLRDREVRPGDVMLLPFYALHRNEGVWDRPDAFDPDRFADPKAIDRFAYLPFGAGPRVCLGMDFGLQEAVIVLATLLSRFRFNPVEGREPEPVMILSLRPGGGVWLQAEPLEPAAHDPSIVGAETA
ncbi:cytochrome P450 [Maritimibacter dapengensis]|uniref:Cytochrome P450 n=1 Tax=Maritimibacter dapengensis TaxID=2836868 RepID=A0ABS6T5I3_9RHOB|nr:cytochrome P450 [Maritimibacter dapengensis]MBV7380485.1 cytochrome P450 [Maritimibacter dapengensis]